MKFDVIISNPPYNNEITTIYHLFIERAIELNPYQYIAITPSRWFCGGKGLDSFRKKFKADRRIVYIKHYTNSKDVFPTVDIKGGVSYFEWKRDYNGFCLFEKVNETPFLNDLDENNVIITDKIKIDIYNKVKNHGNI